MGNLLSDGGPLGGPSQVVAIGCKKSGLTNGHWGIGTPEKYLPHH
jgi:hypothetical protein